MEIWVLHLLKRFCYSNTFQSSTSQCLWQICWILVVCMMAGCSCICFIFYPILYLSWIPLYTLFFFVVCVFLLLLDIILTWTISCLSTYLMSLLTNFSYVCILKKNISFIRFLLLSKYDSLNIYVRCIISWDILVAAVVCYRYEVCIGLLFE